MITNEETCREIHDLFNRLGEQIELYKQMDYNETLTRRDFIDPFLKH
jgi:hypothetical protein